MFAVTVRPWDLYGLVLELCIEDPSLTKCKTDAKRGEEGKAGCDVRYKPTAYVKLGRGEWNLVLQQYCDSGSSISPRCWKCPGRRWNAEVRKKMKLLKKYNGRGDRHQP